MLLDWRPAVLTAIALAWTPPATGQSFLEDPLRFWRHESEYAGAESCEPCHAGIFRRQSGSHHAISLRATTEATPFAESLPVSREDRSSGSLLRLEADPGGKVRLRSELGSETGHALLEWAFGSGAKGITPIGRAEDGAWVESRLTWYESIGDIDFTTGASRYTPRTANESLGRALSETEVAECFGCHTTGYDAESLAPARGEMGIHCERCHGPGTAHVKAAASGLPPADRIFNPGSLKAFPQAQMCGACHGKPPQDNDFDALSFLEQTPHSVRFPSQRIVLSRCFNESFGELSCTTCHDPHLNASDEAGRHDIACLACHDTKTRKRASVCPTASADCASCHMPKERVMRHSLFSDHWIRVVREP